MLKEADFKPVYASGENEPVECYMNGLLNSSDLSLALGFFSSSGIQTLALGFAYFIKNNGKVRIIMSDILHVHDKSAWISSKRPDNIDDYVLADVNSLYKTLSKYDEHFFKCLSWLIKTERIDLKAVKPNGKGPGIAHPKFGVFKDNLNDAVAFSGSVNFSKTAFLYNLEAMSCYRSWKEADKERLEYYDNLYERIWNDQYPYVTAVTLEKVKSFISENFDVPSLSDLLREEELLIDEASLKYAALSKLNPYHGKEVRNTRKSAVIVPPKGIQIREYQNKAFENWRNNNHKGIFAMATGTGKTITALNCIYREFHDNAKKTSLYFCHVLILVPTQTLLEQWVEQLQSWGFSGILKVQSNSNWKNDLQRLTNDIEFDIDEHFVIVATYRSFTKSNFQKALEKLPEDTILIADEAHNLGQQNVKAQLEHFPFSRRIGLTATPKRIYDPEGSEEIEKFFDDSEPYCFSFYMDQAIIEGRLCKYDYFPILVNLENDELEEYIDISKKIAKLSFLTKTHSDDDLPLQRLLLKRKRIINKARNKIEVLRKIIRELKARNSLNYCFTYAPPGEGNYDLIDGENSRIIREMQRVIQQEAPGARTHVYLGETDNRDQVLHGFEQGQIDVLLAINCLDEGVDIPRTEIGIFTASTGNPRQYIQRRGRVLRLHPDKERALIYDMVVIPKIFEDLESKEFFEIEKTLVKNELMRVGYFAKLSHNFYDSRIALDDICRFYQLDLDTVIKELQE